MAYKDKSKDLQYQKEYRIKKRDEIIAKRKAKVAEKNKKYFEKNHHAWCHRHNHERNGCFVCEEYYIKCPMSHDMEDNFYNEKLSELFSNEVHV